MLNKMQGIGNIGRCDFGYTSTQKPKLALGVALYRGQDQEALWINVNAFGDNAVKLSSRLEKGMKIYFEGRLDNYKSEKGVVYWSVLADRIYSLSPKKNTGPGTEQAEAEPSLPLTQQPDPVRQADDDWADLPF